MILTKNFRLSEMTCSAKADELNIPNSPGAKHVDALRNLCVHVLQPMRDALGPIKVTSGYRCPDLCLAIGSTARSWHTFGKAADIKPRKVSLLEGCLWIMENTDFDGMVLELPRKTGGWIHVSYDADKKIQRNLCKGYDGKTRRTLKDPGEVRAFWKERGRD